VVGRFCLFGRCRHSWNYFRTSQSAQGPDPVGAYWRSHLATVGRSGHVAYVAYVALIDHYNDHQFNACRVIFTIDDGKTVKRSRNREHRRDEHDKASSVFKRQIATTDLRR
jgi:hypothetical protein